MRARNVDIGAGAPPPAAGSDEESVDVPFVRRRRYRARAAAATIVVVLGLVAVAARAPSAFQDPLWLDETVSARAIAAPSIGAALRRVRARDSNPPGWHLLSRAVYTTGGGAIPMERLRVLSILFSVALAALVVVYALSLALPLWSAAVAGALVALGTNFVAHGAELRPYSLLALIAAAFAFSLQYAVRRPAPGRLSLLAGVVAIGVLTHYFFLLAVATAALWLVAAAPAGARARVGASLGVGLLALVPWLPSFLHQYRHDLFAYLGPFNWRSVLYAYPRIVGVLGERGALPAAGRLAFACLVIAGLVVLVRRRDPESTLVALMASVPVILAALFWLLGPRIFNERNLLVAGPFVALALAALLPALPRAGAAVVTVFLLAAVGTSIWRYESEFGRASYDGIAGALAEQGWQPTDVIVQFGPAPLGLMRPLGWYLPGRPELADARTARCARRLFVVSYDASAGPAWLAAHRQSILARRSFAAFDHTPRGPRTRPPIVVATLRRPPGLAGDVRRHGGRLYTASPCPA